MLIYVSTIVVGHSVHPSLLVTFQPYDRPVLADTSYSPPQESRDCLKPVCCHRIRADFSYTNKRFRPTAVIRESRPLRRCWLGSRQYMECFTYADLGMKPLCALRPQMNTFSICLNYVVTLTPSLSASPPSGRGPVRYPRRWECVSPGQPGCLHPTVQGSCNRGTILQAAS